MLHEELRRKGVYNVFENFMQWLVELAVCVKCVSASSIDLL